MLTISTARYVLIIITCLMLSNVQAIEIRISDTRANNFYLDALEWVLQKSGRNYLLHYTDHPVSSQKRKLLMLKNGEIDLIYAGTSTDLENTLRAVRFPVMRGLIGRRLLLIHKHHQSLYNSVNSLADLSKLHGLQGIGWSDTQVLRAAGLPQTEKLYDDIFFSLNAGSRNYFPRGMTEIFGELASNLPRLPNISIEERLVVSYPAAVLFFVHPDNTSLAGLLHDGFIKAYEDGSYLEFFYQHPLIKNAFENARLDERITITLSNPFLSEATRAIPAKYWHGNSITSSPPAGISTK